MKKLADSGARQRVSGRHAPDSSIKRFAPARQAGRRDTQLDTCPIHVRNLASCLQNQRNSLGGFVACRCAIEDELNAVALRRFGGDYASLAIPTYERAAVEGRASDMAAIRIRVHD
jgi:hypothetical protein